MAKKTKTKTKTKTKKKTTGTAAVNKQRQGRIDDLENRIERLEMIEESRPEPIHLKDKMSASDPAAAAAEEGDGGGDNGYEIPDSAQVDLKSHTVTLNVGGKQVQRKAYGRGRGR